MSHETNNFFKTEYKRHPYITPCDDTCFGKTVTVRISRTGEMTECFKCGKTHRAFVRSEYWYNGTTCECDGCCPVIRINLPAITQEPQNSKKIH
jgi:hypothetical protein